MIRIVATVAWVCWLVIFFVLGTCLAYSFYHEVILGDAACGSILGTPSNPPVYCDGRPYP